MKSPREWAQHFLEMDIGHEDTYGRYNNEEWNDADYIADCFIRAQNDAYEGAAQFVEELMVGTIHSEDLPKIAALIRAHARFIKEHP